MEFLHSDCNLFFVYVMCIIVSAVSCAPLTDGNGVEQEDLNGEMLLKLGEKLKLPRLQLLGRTIENLEKKIEEKVCDLHPCTAWTQWQGCDARPGQFGSKFRTRQCGMNLTTCELDTNSRIEKESSICIGFCPKEYNVTKNGYCMKLYVDQTRTRDAAEQQCKKDGGHLINIDSDVKYSDVNSLLQGFTNYIWVDGRRKDVSSPWEFTYGSQNSYFKWRSGQPSNRSSELCLRGYLQSGSFVMGDYPCSNGLYAICEIN